MTASGEVIEGVFYFRPYGSWTIEQLRDQLKSACGEYGTQREAALAWGISRHDISKIIAGTREPSEKVLEALGLKNVTYYVGIDYDPG